MISGQTPIKSSMPSLIPSLLSGHHENLLSSLKTIERHHLSWAHLDVMDGHFVPNFSFGPQIIKTLKRHSSLFFDVHLMLEHPERFISTFIEAGANLLSFHVESQAPIAATLKHIREQNCATGLACNPDSPEELLLPWLEQVDRLLFMAVQPGFCGQTFRHDVLHKIAKIAAIRQRRELSFRIAVDGGIDAITAEKCLKAGADVVVSGTSFFDPVKRRSLRKLLP
ncbi:MAG: ribulose-phosphate 3-epimerase [Puniceicoccales bacterium]|jgi:ribulose-phosphate 3-epimerase|nr:ribulose-phosphate 3-epimerase [Puniceicoccales bacterium]